MNELDITELINPLAEELDQIETLSWPRDAKDNLKNLVVSIYAKGERAGFDRGYKMAIHDLGKVPDPVPCYHPLAEESAEAPPPDVAEETITTIALASAQHRKHHPLKAARGLWWEITHA